MKSWYGAARSLSAAAAWEDSLARAQNLLASSAAVLVTGRIHDVSTARGAIRLASRWNGTLDSWESDSAFDAISAIQRSGMHGVSLAEARDLSNLIVVIGNDSLLEDCPRLPVALAKGAKTPVLLLGAWSERGRIAWSQAGFEALAIATPIETLPRSLAQASLTAKTMEWESRAGEWLQQSQYTTVVWSLAHMDLRHGDLWMESMMQWIAARNETKRCASLHWSGLGGTLQQVCTWLTGSPGRIRFQEGVPRYDPEEYQAAKWVASRERSRGPTGRPSGEEAAYEEKNGVMVWIDDSAEDIPAPILDAGLPVIAISSKRIATDRTDVIWLSSQRAGMDSPGVFFRGDQAVMVRGEDPIGISYADELPSAAAWLQGLCES